MQQNKRISTCNYSFGCDPQAAQFQQRTFKLKVAEEAYNQEARIKVSIRDTEPINFVSESAVRLCPDLAQLLQGLASAKQLTSNHLAVLCLPKKHA